MFRFAGADGISFPLPFRTRSSGSALRRLHTRTISAPFNPSLALRVRDPDDTALSRPFDVIDRESGLPLVIIVEGFVGSHHNLDVQSEPPMGMPFPGSQDHIDQLNLVQTLTLLPGANAVSSSSFTRQQMGLHSIVTSVERLLSTGDGASLPSAADSQLCLQRHLFNLDDETWNPVPTEGLSSGGQLVAFRSLGLDIGDFVRVPIHLEILFLRVAGDGLPRPFLRWGFDRVLRMVPVRRARMFASPAFTETVSLPVVAAVPAVFDNQPDHNTDNPNDVTWDVLANGSRTSWPDFFDHLPTGLPA